MAITPETRIKELVYRGCYQHNQHSSLCDSCHRSAMAAIVELLVVMERRLTQLEVDGDKIGVDIKQHDCIQPIAYKVRRKNDGVEYGPFETLAEARIWLGTSDSKELICIYPEVADGSTRVDAPPAGGSGEPGQREDPVGRDGSWEDQNRISVLPEEGSTS